MKRFFSLIALSALLVAAPMTVVAQGADSGSSLGSNLTQNLRNLADDAGLRTDEQTDRLNPLDLFGFYLGLTAGFAGVIFTVQVLHGGFLWMTAGGNEEQIDKARKKILNGAIGAAIVIMAFFITTFVLTQVYNAIDANDQGGFQETTS